MMETQTAIQKPRSVSTAVNLLWVSLAIHLVSTLMRYFNAGGVLASDALTLFPHLLVVVGFTLRVFLIFKIAAGKNWARIVFLVLFVFDVMTLPFMLADFSQTLWTSIPYVAGIGLQAYALFLLFTQPARSWFLRTWRGNPDMTNKEK